MLPSLPVIVLSVLAATGHGMLLWLGVSLLFAPGGGSASSQLQVLQLSALVAGLALGAVGLAATLLQLGRPKYALRAMSGWRSSWAARMPVISLLSMLPGFALLYVLLHRAAADRVGSFALAVAATLALASLAGIVANAMVHAAVRPVPAWRDPLVVPLALLFALVCGLGMMFLLISIRLGSAEEVPRMLVTLAMTAVLVLAAKLLYWRSVDHPASGLRGGEPVARATVHAFARRHARALRLACVLLLAFPIVAWIGAAAVGVGAGWPWLLLATAGVLAGAVIERWLFIAEARQTGLPG